LIEISPIKVYINILKDKIMKKNNKISVSEKILKIVAKQPKSAEEFKKELKDRFGYNIKPEDIRVNLLYLLRRGQIQRKKEDSIYKYHV